MKKISLSIILAAISIASFNSCKEKTSDHSKQDTLVKASEETVRRADSLYEAVQYEWNEYIKLDSAKYKDLKGVYFQLKNLPTTDLKQLASLENKTVELEKEEINLNTPNFTNKFFSYDSLLMIHVREVLDFGANTKEVEKLAAMKDLKNSLLAEIDDNKFVAMQSHIDKAVAQYNEYLKKHPELKTVDAKYVSLPEFGSIDHKTLPMLP